jgi:formylglycine-generating enzyme required for sulfatase activity
MVAVPQRHPSDPQTFYAMENKVWNKLYAVFMAAPDANVLLKKWSMNPGCEDLVNRDRDDWQKGAYAPRVNPDSKKPPFFGVQGPEKARLPVFRVKVTEAHCFAEWLNARLPSQEQWRKAAGCGEDEDSKQGPYNGDPGNIEGLAVALEDGPWAIDRGDRDVSKYGCRQMATNGREWTRDVLDHEDRKTAEIPLKAKHERLNVAIMGRTYIAPLPCTYKDMVQPHVLLCTDDSPDVSFRVVLQR